MGEISIHIDELRSKSLFIATPMYGGMCNGTYTKSMLDTTIMFTQKKIPMRFFSLFNESLITRARNYCVDEFLERSDCTHILFIDADVGFDPKDILTMLALDKDIIGGPYPKKTIAWEKIVEAVQKGIVTQANPTDLTKYVGDYVFNPVGGQSEINVTEPQRVSEIGTGYMMIKRNVFEKFAEAYPELRYRPDHNRSEHFTGDRYIHCYFDALIDPDSNDRYLSEDYMFCKWSQKIGFDIWLCPWMKTTHTGSMVFGGTLRDQAALEHFKKEKPKTTTQRKMKKRK